MLVTTMTSELVVHLIDEPESQLSVWFVAGLSRERKEVANREGIRPEIAPRWMALRQTRPLCELHHQLDRVGHARLHGIAQTVAMTVLAARVLRVAQGVVAFSGLVPLRAVGRAFGTDLRRDAVHPRDPRIMAA
jgi:hypothetical protein